MRKKIKCAKQRDLRSYVRRLQRLWIGIRQIKTIYRSPRLVKTTVTWIISPGPALILKQRQQPMLMTAINLFLQLIR